MVSRVGRVSIVPVADNEKDTVIEAIVKGLNEAGYDTELMREEYSFVDIQSGYVIKISKRKSDDDEPTIGTVKVLS